MNIIHAQEKIVGFLRKLDMWKNRTQQEEYDMFPNVNAFANETRIDQCQIGEVIVSHLGVLQEKFKEYFTMDMKKNSRIQNPFDTNVDNELPSEEEEQLIDLSTDSTVH